jgi:hypothetical protein
MTFWLGVAVAYVLVVALGLSIGRYLAERDPGRDGGIEPFPSNDPLTPAPTFGLEVPPLGSAFDRALLPGAFDEVSAAR